MKEDNQLVVLAPIHFVWNLALIFIHHDYAQIAFAVDLVVVAVTHGGDKTFLPRQYNYVLYIPQRSDRNIGIVLLLSNDFSRTSRNYFYFLLYVPPLPQ